MSAVTEIQTCEEVTPALIDATFDPSTEPHPAQRVLRLLERMARVAKPNTGAHRILLVLARLAQTEWIGGRVEVTLSDFGVATEVDVRVDDGRMPTRWRSFSIAVPLVELTQWVRRWPSAIRPLTPFGEPLADRLQLRAQSPSSAPAPAPEPIASEPVSSKRGPRPDVHRKQTIRLEGFKLPEEAFRATQPSVPESAESAEHRDTARPPPPQPIVPTPAKPDPTDEGWD